MRDLFVYVDKIDFIRVDLQDIPLEFEDIIFETKETPKDGGGLICFQHYRNRGFFFSVVL